jgi:hypothetical protein
MPEFLRRVYLDLTGNRFLRPPKSGPSSDDPAPTKREAVIDRLLASPSLSDSTWRPSFDIMLMERRPDKHLPAAEWQKYLLDVVRAEQSRMTSSRARF